MITPPFHFTTNRADGKLKVPATSVPLTTGDAYGAPSARPVGCAGADKKGHPFAIASCADATALRIPSHELPDAWASFLDRLEGEVGGFEWFATFTFKDDLHPEQANRRYLRFMRRLNEECFGRRYKERKQGLHHVRALEYQRRGVVHFHSLIGGGVAGLRRVEWKEEWLNAEPGNGFARIYQYDPALGARGYLSKYVAKGGEIDIFLSPSQEQRYRLEGAGQSRLF